MGGLRCPKCGRHIVQRVHRIGVVEHVLSAVYVYPFRCQLCGRRFRALQWRKRYVVQTAERREYERVGLRAQVTVVSSVDTVQGEVTELSMEGCTVTMAAPLSEGATVQAELHLLPGQRPVAVAAAIVRSVRATMCGLHFTHIRAEERIRLGWVVTGLLRSQHDASVPEGPELVDGRFRYLRSADVWLAVAVLGMLALVLAMVIPWFSLCTWGVSC
jgi:hypothetical protein